MSYHTELDLLVYQFKLLIMLDAPLPNLSFSSWISKILECSKFELSIYTKHVHDYFLHALPLWASLTSNSNQSIELLKFLHAYCKSVDLVIFLPLSIYIYIYIHTPSYTPIDLSLSLHFRREKRIHMNTCDKKVTPICALVGKN